VWHYKCIRPILNGPNHPNFLCPNCRAVADLEADAEEADSEWEDEEEAIEASKKDSDPKVVSKPQGNDSRDADGDLVMGDRPVEPSATPIPAAVAATDSAVVVNGTAPAVEVQRTGNTTPARPIPVRTGPSRSELSPGRAVDGGPMTPRNDAGPFVLDGGAGRPRVNGTSDTPSAAEDATMQNVASGQAT
jgi:hypothetical protein